MPTGTHFERAVGKGETLPKFQQKVPSLYSKWARHQYDVGNTTGFILDFEEFGVGPVNSIVL
ncbi:unnamed protein product [Prunus armeniaca]